ncbi:allantoinase AllB [Paenibacillus beijingensis]|uniref:Allantoinase n=1 Tax=Paenibacillus beijingensis TaxID=1126833 RepID=A0A0D5NJN5_9BACL|nr:allantoinase AllB [Paenibacillus beijingensis]AJY75589.1 allantoinase [Paenibacillus beijingensis]
MSERFDTIIRGGLVVLEGRDEPVKLDIGIKDGKIAELAPRLEGESASELNAEGKIVLPGGIDMHVHFNEPGMSHWEGFPTGSASLAAGGFTAYADMPLNGLPPTVDIPALNMKAELAAGRSAVDYAFWGGLVPGKLDQLEALAEAGVIAFKAFMSSPGGEGEGRFTEVDELTLYRGMERIASFGGILALHAENDALTSLLAQEAIAAGRTGALDYAASRPPVAELEAVNRALFYAQQTGCKLHFVHISTPEAIDLIDSAKKSGMDVTNETCPHYLILTEKDMERLGPVAKCAPPLRDSDRVEAMWERLAAGKIDMVTSDHSPCTTELKDPTGKTFFDSWGGISGAQSSLELLFHEGVNRRKLPVGLLARVFSEGPARRFGLYPAKGAIAKGFDADLAIIDPNESYMLTAERLLYRNRHSPYTGMEFSCRVSATLCRGQLVYTAEDGIVKAAGGARLSVKPGKALKV